MNIKSHLGLYSMHPFNFMNVINYDSSFMYIVSDWGKMFLIFGALVT